MAKNAKNGKKRHFPCHTLQKTQKMTQNGKIDQNGHFDPLKSMIFSENHDFQLKY
mgnify:CR=1 FL=1